MNPIRLFGIETEYGIAREDCETADPVVESMELVRAYLDGQFTRRWDYRGEHPHEDQRGFRVTELAQDKDTFSPGRTRSRSPGRTSLRGTSSSLSSSRTRRAV